MKDERIVGEINSIKGYILLYIFIVSILFSIFKFLIHGFIYQLYLVEGFAILVSGIILLLTYMIKSSQSYDERLENKVKNIYKSGYTVLVIGGFWIHFYSVATLPAKALLFGYITNTLILIGFIVLLVLLKRKKTYANYKMIEGSRVEYFKQVFMNICKVFMLFIVILGSILLLNYLFEIFVIPLNLFLRTLIISFVLLSIEYFVFSVYEKNHYDETVLFEKGIPNHLTKNSALFFVFIFIFQILSGYANLKLSLAIVSQADPGIIYNWEVYNKMFLYLSLDFAIIRLVMMLIIYLYVKKIAGKRFIIKMVLANAILSFIVTIANSMSGILSQLADLSIESFVALRYILNYSYLGFSILFLGYVLLIAFNLYKYNIVYRKVAYIYVGVLVIFNPILTQLIFQDNLSASYISTYLGSLVKGTLLLVMYILYSHKQINASGSNEKIELIEEIKMA